ncbi:MAG TPA: glycosyltransferase family 4 protein [Vicinamibacterales bacterium]
MKLACVVQRYGADIAGGSEAHCRALAERLGVSHAVTVLTSCARDYVTWANAHPAGETVENGVRVVRFPVRRQRQLGPFSDLSDEVFDGPTSRERQQAWFAENGPDVPGLLDHLRTHGADYDLVLFWTFRYSPSFFGLPLVAGRAVLLPTAEEDRALDLDVLEDFFRTPAGYIFLTPEETALVEARAGGPLRPATTIGMGLERSAVTAGPASQAALATLGVPPRYVLYLGRVDRNKGCHTLLEYFQEYAAGGSDATLVLAGPAKIRVPEHPRIRALGYVTDDARDALLSGAQALVVPSPYESLSIVLLEAWNRGVPALVNAHCAVLKGQVRRANGGLHYRSQREFSAGLDVLLGHQATREQLGRQGLAYVDREYRWPTVLARVEALLEEVLLARRTREGTSV